MKQKTFILGILTALLIITLPACKDSPEDRAAKQLRQDMHKALDTVISSDKLTINADDKDVTEVDIAQIHQNAIKTVQNALAARINDKTVANLLDRDKKALANLVSGNLASDQAQALQLKLPEKIKPVNDLIEKIAKVSNSIRELEVQKTNFEKVQETTQTQIADLKKIINDGQGDQPGLTQQLAAASQNLADLQAQKDKYDNQADLAQQAIDDINAEVDKKVKLAEVAVGEDELELREQAFELKLSAKQFYTQKQDAMDMALVEQGKIDILKPLVEKMQEDIQDVQLKISNLEDPQKAEKLNQALADIQQQQNADNRQTANLANQAATAHSEYVAAVEQIITIYNQAVADYGKAGSGDISRLKGLRLAHTLHQFADVAQSAARSNSLFSDRITLITQNATQQTRDALQKLAEETAKAKALYAASALNNYNLAITEYEKNTSGKLANDTQISLLIALYAKSTLARLTQNDTLLEETVNKALALIDSIKQNNPAILRTIPAKLFQGSYDFTPQVKVDLEVLAEARRALFRTGWDKLQGQRKKAEVERLLALYEQLKLTELPEVIQMLATEKQALDDAVRKGFAEPTTTTTSDPNSFF